MAYISGDMTNLLNSYSSTDFSSLSSDVSAFGLAAALSNRASLPIVFFNGLDELCNANPFYNGNAAAVFAEAASKLAADPNNRVQALVDIYDYNPSVISSSWALEISIKKTASGFYVIDIRIKHYNGQ